MRPVLRSIAALTMLFALIQSCAAQPSTTAVTTAPAASSTSTTSSAPVRDRNLLTREEILRGEYQTAYDAVLARRRTWLIQRADGETTKLVVYLDDMRLGGAEELRAIAVARISEIKYFDGTAAYARWGFGHDGGVVQVISMAPTTTRP